MAAIPPDLPVSNDTWASASASAVAIYSEMRAAIEAAHSIAQAKDLRDRVEAIRVYAHLTQARELENLAAEARLWAEHKAGQFLLSLNLKAGRPGNGSREEPFPAPTLDKLGIGKKRSAAWQRVGRMSAQQVEERLRVLRGLSKPASTNSFLASGAAMSSSSDSWLTPPEIIEAVLAVLGEVDLDPCSNAHGSLANVPARNHFARPGDGLGHPWGGRVYMNPPYGEVVGSWVDNLVAQYNGGSVREAIALVAARTDTQWFSRIEGACALVCFVHGRLRFGGGTTASSAPFPSALFYLGSNREKFARVFGAIGSLFVPYEVGGR